MKENEMHPIKRYRTDAHMTQRELASIAGITEQVILKAEQGLYPTLPLSVLNSVSQLTGQGVTEIEDEYEAWNYAELAHVKLPPAESDSLIQEPMTFKHYMHLVCELNNRPTNVNSFCKVVKIHPYVIQKWASGKMNNPPVQLLERISYIREHSSVGG